MVRGLGRATFEPDLVGTRRCDITSSELSTAEVQRIARNQDLRSVQFTAPLSDCTYDRLNEELFAQRPDVEFRVYGRECRVDLAFAARMTNVQHFAADCLRDAVHIERIAAMTRLRSLSLGILSLRSFDVLALLPRTLSSLRLLETRSKKPSLGELQRFSHLRELMIEGHTNDIDVVHWLTSLRSLTLRSIRTPDAAYLAGLPELGEVRFLLGGIRSFEAVSTLPKLESLEIGLIRGLEDLSFVSSLAGLRMLKLRDLCRVACLPSLSNLPLLRCIHLENMRALQDLTGLGSAIALEEFRLVGGKGQTAAQLAPVLANRNVMRIEAFFGSDRENESFAAMLRSRSASLRS